MTSKPLATDRGTDDLTRGVSGSQFASSERGTLDRGTDPGLEEPGSVRVRLPRIPPPKEGSWRTYRASQRPTADRVTALLRAELLDTSEIRELRVEALYSSSERAREIYRAIQSKTPYRSQRDNMAFELVERKKDGKWILNWLGDKMCNLTSLARAMQAQGISFDTQWGQGEDELEAIRPTKDLRTQASTLMNLARDNGMNLSGLVWKGWQEPNNIDQDEWESIQSDYLDQGFSIIFSIGGHIMTLQQVTSGGLLVDDPYGQVTLKPSGTVKKQISRRRGGRQVVRETYAIGPDKPREYWEYAGMANKRYGPEAWRGNDHLIPWNDALAHRMHWVMVIGGTEIAN